MSYPDEGTVKELQAVRDAQGTLRKTALALGFPESYAAVFSGILNRKENACSRAKENEIRRALNLFPLGVTELSQVPRGWLGDLIRCRS